MAPHPVIPAELTRGPFTLVEARQAGLSSGQLRGTSWRRIGSSLYVWAALGDDPVLLLAALHRGLPVGAAFSGKTAAWLHGLDLPPCAPVEVTIPESCGTSARAGMAVRRGDLPDQDVVERRGMRVTSAVRTMADLSSRLPLVEAVVAMDMAHTERRWIWNRSTRTWQRVRGARAWRASERSWSWPSRRRSRRWKPACACCSCRRDSRALRHRSPCTTSAVASWAGRISTTELGSQADIRRRMNLSGAIDTYARRRMHPLGPRHRRQRLVPIIQLMETGLIVIALLYLALSIWAIARLLIQTRNRARIRRS